MLQHQTILVKENIYLRNDGKRVKSEAVKAKECMVFYPNG